MQGTTTSDITELQTVLLRNRGINTGKEADIFLHPDFEKGIHDPFLLQDMQVAVDRILLATQRKEKIVIYGDYDCDGIPGSVVMHDFFKKIKYEDFLNYIPHRHKEGYGLHKRGGFCKRIRHRLHHY
jgi:single-stranded-DNA-specific exonuclease